MSAGKLIYEGSGERLDSFLHAYLVESLNRENLSRSQVQKWIEEGGVKVQGERVSKAGVKLRKGEVISWDEPPIEPSKLTPISIDLTVLHEDEDLIVIDKPSGLSMHPGAGERRRTVVQALLGRVAGGDPIRPGVVHRLDKDTTGVVVLAKNTDAHFGLAKQFAERSVSRRYLALAFTTPRARRALNTEDQGKIDKPLGRHPREKTKMMISEEGKKAVTHWSVVERYVYGTLIRCRLETGRTHQIRVHLDSIGSPLIGDEVYGDFSGLPKKLAVAADDFGRQALHAESLGFEHPRTKKKLSFESPLPHDFKELIKIFSAYKG